MSESNECPVCQDLFTNPRLLPCMHTLCLLCCEDTLRTALADQHAPVCPLCFEPLLITDVLQLAENFSLQPNKTSNDGAKCLEHPQQECDTVCMACKCFVCHECVEEHQNLHKEDVVNISTAVFQCCKELTAYKARLDDGAVELCLRRDYFQNSAQAQLPVVQQVRDFFNPIVHQHEAQTTGEVTGEDIQQRRDQLLTEVNSAIKILQLQSAFFSDLLDQCQRVIHQVTSMVSLLQLNPTAIVQVVRCIYGMTVNRTETIIASLQDMKPLPTDTAALHFGFVKSGFLENTPLMRTSLPLLGSIRYEHENIESIKQPVRFFAATPRDLACLLSGNLAVISSKCEVSIMTPDGKLVRTIKNKNFKWMHYIAVSPVTGHIWLSDFQSACLHCMTEDGVYIRRISSKNAFGLTVLPSGNVCCANHSSKTVCVYSPLGKPIVELGGPDNFHILAGMGALSNGDLVVAQRDYGSKPGRLIVFSGKMDGSIVNEIGVDVITGGDGVSVTLNNFIVVNETSSRFISVWTPSGLLVNRFHLDDSLLGGFTQLHDGHLAIANSVGVKIF